MFEKPREIVSRAFYAYKSPEIAEKLCSYMGVYDFLDEGGIDPMIILKEVMVGPRLAARLSREFKLPYIAGGVDTSFSPEQP